MRQQYENYQSVDFEVWKILFERQIENLKDKASSSYLNYLKQLAPVLNGNSIPKFEALNRVLMRQTGWSIEVVPGLIPVADFFELLSQKKFCSSTWLRKMEQLDYLEEPDMFHDIFGHIPLFMDQSYGDFAQKMGQVGCQFKSDEQVLIELQRIYWFTIEFGLLKGKKPKIYGAGILSSFGESSGIYRKETTILKFDLSEIIKADFCNAEIQTKYFQLDALTDLYEAFDLYAEKLVLSLNHN